MVRKGQLDDTFSKTSAAMHGYDIKQKKTTEKVQGAGGEEEEVTKETVNFKRTARVLEAHPSDESSDWTMVAKPAFSVPQAGKDSDDDMPPARKKGCVRVPPSSSAGIGDQTKKRRSSPAEKKSGQGNKCAKVFPSQQQREINAVRCMVADAQSLLDSAKNFEGFHAMTPTKIKMMHEKITKKLATTKETLQFPNGVQAGETQSLQSQGEAMIMQLTTRAEQLAALLDASRSVNAKGDSLEASPRFLERAIQALASSGFGSPQFLTALVAKNNVWQQSKTTR